MNHVNFLGVMIKRDLVKIDKFNELHFTHLRYHAEKIKFTLNNLLNFLPL